MKSHKTGDQTHPKRPGGLQTPGILGAAGTTATGPVLQGRSQDPGRRLPCGLDSCSPSAYSPVLSYRTEAGLASWAHPGRKALSAWELCQGSWKVATEGSEKTTSLSLEGGAQGTETPSTMEDNKGTV